MKCLFKSEFDKICDWVVRHPGSGIPVKFTGTFKEVEYKYFEGFNPPCMVVDGKQEEFSISYNRVSRYFKSKK